MDKVYTITWSWERYNRVEFERDAKIFGTFEKAKEYVERTFPGTVTWKKFTDNMTDGISATGTKATITEVQVD